MDHLPSLTHTYIIHSITDNAYIKEMSRQCQNHGNNIIIIITIIVLTFVLLILIQ